MEKLIEDKENKFSYIHIRRQTAERLSNVDKEGHSGTSTW
jgi:hypothetical protein